MTTDSIIAQLESIVAELDEKYKTQPKSYLYFTYQEIMLEIEHAVDMLKFEVENQ